MLCCHLSYLSHVSQPCFAFCWVNDDRCFILKWTVPLRWSVLKSPQALLCPYLKNRGAVENLSLTLWRLIARSVPQHAWVSHSDKMLLCQGAATLPTPHFKVPGRRLFLPLCTSSSAPPKQPSPHMLFIWKNRERRNSDFPQEPVIQSVFCYFWL